jgi:hypothetical protein
MEQWARAGYCGLQLYCHRQVSLLDDKLLVFPVKNNNCNLTSQPLQKKYSTQSRKDNSKFSHIIS